MAAWYDGLSLTVEVSFSTAPLATPSWTDITSYVRAVPHVERGRSSEYSEIAPSTATVILDNRDNRFDPDNGSSPYSPNVVPMRRIRITWSIDASSGTLFDGFVEGWPQAQEQNADATSTIHCVDGTRFVKNDPLATSAYRYEVEADDPVHYWPMQADDNGQMLDVAGNLDVPISGFDGFNDTTQDPTGVVNLNISTADAVYPLGESVAMWSQGYATSTPSTLPRTLEFWMFNGTGSSFASTIYLELPNLSGDAVRFAVWPGGSANDWFTVQFEDPANNKKVSTATDTGFVLTNDGDASHVVVTTSSTDITIYLNGQQVFTDTLATGTTTWIGSSPLLSIRGNVAGDPDDPDRLSHVAFYDAELSAARVSAHYEAGLHAYGYPINEKSGERIGRVLDEMGWPTADRDLSTGTIPQGPYLPNGARPLDYIRQVETSEQGLFFFDVDGNATFRDREWFWTQAASATVLTDDGAAADVEYADLVREGNHVDTIANIVSFSYGSVGGVTQRDATSITDHGPAPEQYDTPTLPDSRTASNMAKYVLRERKDPRTRISSVELLYRITGGDNNVAKILALELGDVITVEQTPVGAGSQRSYTVQVLGMSHEIDANQGRTILYLSPAPTINTAAPYLTVGNATYGKIGAVAGNLIPG